MNPKCGRCTKTVYPMEKVNALDKFWHKGCFKCLTCGLTLTMKTYKGYDKQPYCNTHYPTTKFTQVAETPEMARVKKNTTNQSAINYTKDQRSLQGKKTSVSDDPETMRIKKNTKNQSQAEYHGLSQQRTTENYHRDLESDQLAGTNRQVGVSTAPKQVGSLFGSEPEPQPYEPPPPQVTSHAAPPAAPQAPPASQGPLYKAVYDYEAAADDEVSFAEGDIIINGQVIDDGWMTGTVQRTMETGMLPSNYVELA